MDVRVMLNAFSRNRMGEHVLDWSHWG